MLKLHKSQACADTFPLEINKKRLLCIHILPGSSKPVFFKDRVPLGGRACFKRSGLSTISIPILKIKDLLASSQESDESVVKDVDLEVLEFDTLIDLLP